MSDDELQTLLTAIEAKVESLEMVVKTISEKIEQLEKGHQ